jgi:hypothetical protein
MTVKCHGTPTMAKFERLKNLNFEVILEFPKMFLFLKLKSSIKPGQVAFKDFVKIGWFPLENYLNMAIMTNLRHFKSSFQKISTDLEKSLYKMVFSDPKSI